MAQQVVEVSVPKFYPIIDTLAVSRRGTDPVTVADVLLSAGARIVQFRHKAHFDRNAFTAAAKISELCRDAGAQFVMNDRADIAMLLDADLHIGQDDLPPPAARRLVGRERRLGLSTHNQNQLAAAESEPIDYVALGPIFGTVSKDNPDPIVGLFELARLRSLTPKPVVAIGGVTRANAVAAWNAGADSVAVIGDLLPEDCSKDALRQRAEEWIELSRT
jgi:thiamine-phosphate pyrophosphorylase